MVAPAEIIRSLDESVRVSIEQLRDWYFGWLQISTLIVAIGCVLELPEVIHEHCRKAFPKRLNRPIKVVATIGLGLVIAGVAGEYVLEARVATADGLVQTLDELLLTDTERETAIAELETARVQDDMQYLKTEEEKAKRDLEKITGPPHVMVADRNGIAIPDLSKSDKQFIELRRNTTIVFPLMPKGKSLGWKLLIAQDKAGGHQFSFSPTLNWPGNKVFFSTCVADMVTTDSQTFDMSLGGAICSSVQGATLQ